MARRRYRSRRRYRKNPDDSMILILGLLGVGAIYLMSQNATTTAALAAQSTTGGQVASVLTAGSSLATAVSGWF